ncbi:MAG TPA: VOC family protein [Jatrophihabitans sp.]|jgi:hypothetical protein
MAVGTLWSITLDCADPEPLAEFWSAVVGGTVAYRSEQFIGIESAGGPWIGAYVVPDYVAPQWPDGTSPKQFHLDLSVADLDAAEAALVDLGAAKAEHQPEPDRWRVFLDPAGHPFCITTMS